MLERTINDKRVQADDYLLAEKEGHAVGTTTSLSLTLWARGGAVPCQGVAWVGVTKAARRQGGDEPGIATLLMRETIRKAREREQVVSALMPFRASYYEHFGYGIVEQRNEWTIPLSILPKQPIHGFRFYEPGDRDAMARCRQRAVERGQCDIERSDGSWTAYLQKAHDGFLIVEDTGNEIASWMILLHEQENGRDYLRLESHDADSPEKFARQLAYLAGLQDQYHAVRLAAPTDLPLNWLFKERQLPHRPVNHTTAQLRTITRMQLRVLDHKRFIEAMRFPADRSLRVSVGVREAEGSISQFMIEIEQGFAKVKPTAGDMEFECDDRVWAAVVCGAMRAPAAAAMGLATCASPQACQALDIFAEGPAPFCSEYF
jgi:predicted acetyltransferase